MICEVLIKSTGINPILIDYFGFKNGKGICNGIYINGLIAISAIGLNNLINWDNKEDHDKYALCTFTQQIKQYQLFYKEKKLIPVSVVLIKEVEKWLKEISHFFDSIDAYFKLNKSVVVQMSSSIILLQINSNLDIAQCIKPKVRIFIGQKIYSINSNLSFISHKHFSHSYSKGIVSNRLTDHIYLIDIRGIPNSLFSLVYETRTDSSIMLIMTVLNTTMAYSPLLFGFSLSRLEEIMMKASHKTKTQQLMSPPSIIQYDPSLRNILEATFMLYDDYSSATCFHIGNGILITAKHFFNKHNMTQDTFHVVNSFHSFHCTKYMLPDNSVDIALLKINNTDQYHKLPFIEINSTETIVNPLTSFYSYQYSLFPQLNRPNMNKGCISKVIKYKGQPCLYQLDCSCYNGASGSPMISTKTHAILGMVYQNIAISVTQLQSISFAYSREVLYEIYHNKNDINQLKQYWLFSVSDDVLDKLLFLSLFKAKL